DRTVTGVQTCALPISEEGGLAHDSGRLAFNTHGGLLSHAYVLGIAHVVEVVKQLRGTAPAQVPGCEVGVYGGYTGGNASTLILQIGRASCRGGAVVAV